MKLVSNILIVFSIISLCRAQCGSPTDQTNTMFTNIQDGINLISNCDFPTNKFNASCVSASCSQLASSGLCPYASGQNLNLTALASILSILSDCFQQQTTICDTPITNIAIPPLAVSLSQVFNALPLGGQCSKAPNSGDVNGVSNVSFALGTDQSSTTTGPLNVVIDAPGIVLSGDILCSISVGGSSSNSPLAINLPNANFTLNVVMSPTASIDFSTDQPQVRAKADDVSVSLQFGNFVPINSAIQLPAGVQSLLTSGVTALYKASGNPTAIANFYATFVAYGIEATKANCPS